MPSLLLFSLLLTGPALLAQSQPEPFSVRVTFGYTEQPDREAIF